MIKFSFVLIVKLLILIYFLILLFLNYKQNRSPKLVRAKAKKLIKKEIERLSIQNKNISWRFTEKNGSWAELKNGRYFINFGKKAVENTIKHELYHIYRGDCDNHGKGIHNWIRIKLILYPFLFEFRAKLYASYGVKF